MSGTSRTVLSFGLENPTLASSEAPGHAASLANDGDAATGWQAADNRPGAWWQVDLERIVTATQVQLTFPEEGNYRYKIEVSEDGVRWALVVDDSETTSTANHRTDSIPSGTPARFIRITFTGLPSARHAALQEATIFGWPAL